MTSKADTAVKCHFASFLGFLPLKANLVQTRQVLPLLAINRNLPHPVSVDLGMWKVKRFARLTIRIPRELKDKIQEIDRLYGVALPKVANEWPQRILCVRSAKKQTPTVPVRISPSDSTTYRVSVRKRQRIRNGDWQIR